MPRGDGRQVRTGSRPEQRPRHHSADAGTGAVTSDGGPENLPCSLLIVVGCHHREVVGLAEALQDQVVVLDGGLATELERRGNDLSSALWSARLLTDAPDEIVAAHRVFFDAGAQVAITASYQASFAGFATVGLGSKDAARLMVRSVELARTAAASCGWVAASVGPYGACSPRVGVPRRLRAERRRSAAVSSSAAGVLAGAGAEYSRRGDSVSPRWSAAARVETDERPRGLSISCDGFVRGPASRLPTIRDGTRRRQRLCGRRVNCIAPRAAASWSSSGDHSGKPVVVYPNSGERWDAQHSLVRRRHFQPTAVAAWVRSGARLVGGCCRSDQPISDALAATVRAGARG